MKKMFIALAIASVSVVRAFTITENFTNDPSLDGWQVFGDTNLFQWNSTNHVLDVTWDSSQPNSYFYKPLGTTLANDDDFNVEFDLQLTNITWNGTFQIAVGLLNFADATDTNFLRAVGTTPNLFEFDYFPDSGDGFEDPNIAASMTDSTAADTDFPDFYFIYDDLPMNTGVTYHVKLAHTAGTATISGEVFTNGQIYTTMPFSFAGDLAGFRLDTLAVISYSTNGDSFGDSIFAQGTVDNFVVTMPPVVRNLAGALSNGIWQAQCGTYTNWLYTLERSTNLTSWNDVSTSANGTGDIMVLSDTNAPADKAFYRVRAEQ